MPAFEPPTLSRGKLAATENKAYGVSVWVQGAKRGNKNHPGVAGRRVDEG